MCIGSCMNYMERATRNCYCYSNDVNVVYVKPQIIALFYIPAFLAVNKVSFLYTAETTRDWIK